MSGRLELGNREFIEIVLEPPKLPEGLSDVEGTKTFVGGSRFARVIGDSVMRWTNANLKQTNMTYPYSFMKDGQVYFSKYVMRLDKRIYWVNEWWKKLLGIFMWGKYIEPGFGYQDTNSWPSDGQYKQQTIDCGLNVRKLVGEPFWTRKGQYVEIEAIDYFDSPNPNEINYYLTPHLFVKQTVVGTSTEQPVYYIAHQKFGDLVWPNLKTYSLLHSMNDLELFPELPFETEYMGVPVTIDGYCFQESSVFGRINGKWHILEETTGVTGNAVKDRKTYVSNWIKTPPVPIRGWTLNKEPSLIIELWNWVKSLMNF